jgi:type IV pilus assembly protein PilM
MFGILSKLYSGACPLGVDIGSFATKVVQLEPGKDGLLIKRAGQCRTPPDSTKAGVITDPQSVASSLMKLLEEMQVNADAAVAAVAGPTVVVRKLQLPAMSVRQLRASIRWEARSHISFPLEDSVVEFQILRTNGQSGHHMEVMLAATPRDMVDSRVETLELAGLQPVAVEVEPFSALRAVVQGGELVGPEETVAVVGLGASFSDINLLSKNNFVLTRSIPLAGNNLTEAIASALSMDAQKANNLKETGMQVVGSEEERALLDPFAQQASRAVEHLLEELIREVRRSLAYYDYQQQAPADAEKPQTVERVVLVGGTARLQGLASYMESQLGVPVQVADLLRNQKIQASGADQENLTQQSSALTVGIGLAMREITLSRQGRGGRTL